MGHPSPRPAAPKPEPSSSGLRVKDLGLQPPAPFVLGRYLVVDEIGRGGMASVHLGRMDGPGGFQKWAAIKRIHPHLVENERFVDMFLDEARTAAGISHANVAQVFELGRDQDTYWLAMEYLHGEPLREVLRRAELSRARVAPALAARICADAALGLHAAHELCRRDGSLLGLVHRDVSPHNLFVTYDGRTKVVDFGIAKSADRLAEETGVGILKGKIAYMSPEQVNREPVDRRTDVFALGVVLWEMTTGRRLFRADTDLETLARLLDCVVPRPSTIVPGYPPELEACVLAALARRKEDRFATARDLSRALQQYLVHCGELVGVEEVAELMRGLFADRMRTRDAHLAWAGGLPAPSDAGEPRTAVVKEPELLDDEDVPTTVGIPWPVAPGPALHVPQAAGASSVDLGATVALPISVGPLPSPAFAQHRAPPRFVPPPFAPAPPVVAVPATPPIARLRIVAALCVVVLGVLGACATGALVVHALRAHATPAAPAR